jgi:hypothetical protein
MDDRKRSLISKAFSIYKEIFPCHRRDTLYDCFTTDEQNQLIFWFNTAEGSTRILIEGR